MCTVPEYFSLNPRSSLPKGSPFWPDHSQCRGKEGGHEVNHLTSLKMVNLDSLPVKQMFLNKKFKQTNKKTKCTVNLWQFPILYADPFYIPGSAL